MFTRVQSTTVDELARRLGLDADLVRQHLAELGEMPAAESDVVDPASANDLAELVTNEASSRNKTTSQTASPATTPLSASKRLAVNGLGSADNADSILAACRSAVAGGGPLVLDFQDAHGFFPNGVVPAVAIVDHYRRAGLDVRMVNLPAPATAMRIGAPIRATEDSLRSEPTLARVWTYQDHNEANALTTAIVDAIRHRVECTVGVAEALEWCLYEVLDNVTQHAETAAGFVMAQHHATSKRLAVCVADTGIGIQRSLASSVAHRPRTAFDALTLAIREGVTRNPATNQGNGLFGLFQIIEQNYGRLNIRSGRGAMRIEAGRISGDSGRLIIGPDNHGTTVDFQLASHNPISLAKALNYDRPNLFLESLENETGDHVIQIRQQAGGAGSRAAARELRTYIANILNEGAPFVTLDFDGQSVVSSSFADEVIGKLVVDMGFMTFNSRVRLINMTPTVTTLLDRSIALRITQK